MPAIKPDWESLSAKLKEFGQEHLLDHKEALNDQEQEAFFKELSGLDLAELNGDFERCVSAAEKGSGKLDDLMEPLSAEQCGSIMNASQDELQSYEKTSFEAIAAGKMGILLLAGGQGTRLGVAYPKGMYDVGLPSGKSVFQLQAERILKLERLAEEKTGRKGGKIAWYIMTSASTVKPTTDFFEKNSYFGLDKKNVVVFQQGTLPCFTFAGKIILSGRGSLARAPDGNGGLYRALRVDGILDDMEKRGVEFIQLFCVDNILVRVGDPAFSGYCIQKGAECANKVVPKGFPHEAVGITCKVDGKYQVVEYSEITDASAEKRNADGSLTYSAANICIHFFTRDFLRRVVDEHEKQLVHHVARKKIPFVDANGDVVAENDDAPEPPGNRCSAIAADLPEGTYRVEVTGFENAALPAYTLDVDYDSPCGNNIVEMGEQCDDGNQPQGACDDVCLNAAVDVR